MGLNRQEKADMIKEISEIIAGTEGLVIAEYRGLTVDAATKLRKEARENGVQLRVLKNTLARRAVKDTPFEGLSDQFVGPFFTVFLLTLWLLPRSWLTLPRQTRSSLLRLVQCPTTSLTLPALKNLPQCRAAMNCWLS